MLLKAMMLPIPYALPNRPLKPHLPGEGGGADSNDTVNSTITSIGSDTDPCTTSVSPTGLINSSIPLGG